MGNAEMLNLTMTTIVMVLTQYFIFMLLAAYPVPINERPEDIPISIFILAVMELMLLMIIRVIYSTLEGKERDQKEEELQHQLALSEQQFLILYGQLYYEYSLWLLCGKMRWRHVWISRREKSGMSIRLFCAKSRSF